MTNPVHRLKKFVKYAGNEKPSSCYITEADGWLSSGITDRDGDDNVPFTLNCLCTPFLEVIGHIAEETT